METMPEVILDAEEMEARPWQPFDDSGRVSYRPLWVEADSKSYAGVLRIEPGAAVAAHAHQYAVHHVWVAEGGCSILGRRLTSGSYAFVPAGVEHGIDGVGPEGCSLFYLYLRAEMD